MKKAKTWNLIGCILGVAVIVAGIYFAATPADSYSTSSVVGYTFGADFYTEIYNGVDAAVDNTAVTANNLRELGEKLALYSGVFFIVLGALIEIHFAKLVLVKETTAAPLPAAPEAEAAVLQEEPAASGGEDVPA